MKRITAIALCVGFALVASVEFSDAATIDVTLQDTNQGCLIDVDGEQVIEEGPCSDIGFDVGDAAMDTFPEDVIVVTLNGVEVGTL